MAIGIEYDAVIRREIWVKHYCSSHRILLVGEGDFSFSLSLAQSFGSASNIVASSLDSYAELIKMYKQANSNLVKLVKLGADLFHEVDATKMERHPHLKMLKFDRIIFNFPHAGFYGKEDNILLIQMHREVVHGFLRNARDMLRDNGEIHVNHKTTFPYNQWNLEELASQNSLALIDCVDFRAEDHPGYNNKRGQGPDSDDSFRLGACSTYKFGLSPHTKKMPKISSSLDTARITFQNFVQPPIETVRQPIAAVPQPIVPYEFRQSQTNFAPYANNIPGYVVSRPTVGIRNECSRIFPGNFSHVMETFRRNDCEGDVYDSVHRALNLGFATYMAEVPGRDLSGHIELLEELHRRRDSRLAWLEWGRTLVSHHQW